MGIDNSDRGTMVDTEMAAVEARSQCSREQDQRGTNNGLLITMVDDAPNEGLGGASRREEEGGGEGAIILECGGANKRNDATMLKGNGRHAAAVVVHGRIPLEGRLKTGIG